MQGFFQRSAAVWACAAAVLLTPPPGGRAQTVATVTNLHSFTFTDGSRPTAALVEGFDGGMYGTTSLGGSVGTGEVFELTPFNTINVLYSFTLKGKDSYDKADGGQPEGSLLLVDNVFYGTTYSGGDYSDGTIFEVSTIPSVSFDTLYTFDPGGGSGGNLDGANPQAGLIKGKDSLFYGTSYQGGRYDEGTIFQTTGDGYFDAVYSFGTARFDGQNPQAALIQTGDDSFYGTTSGGGESNEGTVFQFTASGGMNRLYSFSPRDDNGFNSDGAHPTAALILASDDNFYGTTTFGGANGTGTIFQLTPTGTLTTLHTFAAFGSNNANADGALPSSALVQGIDGNLYGVTPNGGTNGTGTIFQVTLTGGFTSLYSFSSIDANSLNADGALPRAPLVESSFGDFYGTTYDGGTAGQGTIFVVSLLPTITSPDTATAALNQPFSYQLVATNNPTSVAFNAAGGPLPPGLSLDPTTGIISGTPTQTGVYSVSPTAFNAFGGGSFSDPTDTLTITVIDVPVVSVSVAGDNTVTGDGPKGKVIVHRTGDTTAALTVFYKVKGSAQADTDYKMLSGSVTIPAGAAQVKVKVKPLDDPAADGIRTVKFTLLAATDGSYTVGTPAKAKIKIIETP